MYCEGCGRTLSHDARFCSQCGRTVLQADTASTATRLVPKSTQSADTLRLRFRSDLQNDQAPYNARQHAQNETVGLTPYEIPRTVQAPTPTPQQVVVKSGGVGTACAGTVLGIFALIIILLLILTVGPVLLCNSLFAG